MALLTGLLQRSSDPRLHAAAAAGLLSLALGVPDAPAAIAAAGSIQARAQGGACMGGRAEWGCNSQCTLAQPMHPGTLVLPLQACGGGPTEGYGLDPQLPCVQHMAALLRGAGPAEQATAARILSALAPHIRNPK